MTDWPDGYGLHVLDEVDSTLNEAARLAPTMSGPVWILARRQRAGRGRRGRAWSDPEGNLAATLVMRPEGPPAQSALRSFVAALALYDACAAVTGRTGGLALKWPNDVLLNGGKLAGILLESAGAGRSLSYLAIGIGVNLAGTPADMVLDPGALRPVSLAQTTGVRVAPEDFLTELAAAYAVHETRFVTHGFGPTRNAWLDRAARLGEVITARTGSETRTGRFETVDGSGNLILATAAGRVSVPAADIYF